MFSCAMSLKGKIDRTMKGLAYGEFMCWLERLMGDEDTYKTEESPRHVGVNDKKNQVGKLYHTVEGIDEG